jgi:proline racemase
MLPHQQRVIDERDQLAERLDKLRAFITLQPQGGTVSIFDSLDKAEREDLRSQARHMREYKAILDRRIARFTA